MSNIRHDDEREIRQLVARYCHAIATSDDEAWASTWAEDGEWRVLGNTVRGRDAVLEHYRKLVANVSFVVQMAFDGIVEVEGDQATGQWQIVEYVQFQGPNGGRGAQNIARYRDRYVRGSDGAWRFALRDLEPIYLGPPDLSAAPARPRRSAS